ncbi:MAG: peptidylprolyl isomerase [Archaeoglobaceae archaeon]
MLSIGDFVRVSYTAKLEDGRVIDTTDAEVAKKEGIFNENARYGDIYIVLGEGHVLKGFEEDIVGKEVGYKGVVVVSPEKGFGEYDPNKKDTFSITRFKETPQIGQRVRIGDKIGTVERIVGRRVVVDFNHPLAGKKITFEYEVKEKLEKPEDKLKALFLIHTGVEVKEVTINADKAIVEVPTDSYLNQLFLIGRYRVVRDAFRFLNLGEIKVVEKFEKGEVAKIEEVKAEVKSTENQ